ncbi:hypothetical protein J2S55_006561 [Streptosporangium brasiliense]|uniref:Uncharacterized protein n=1 Tax=Streptosporangium brasiliense TaxID=47480 RepID=A0ABT9RG29_9ACTN|nr:hypothetical protein [Streptosporangium brasiliense]
MFSMPRERAGRRIGGRAPGPTPTERTFPFGVCAYHLENQMI